MVAQAFQFADIQKLSGSSIRLAGIPFDLPSITYYLRYQFRQFPDGQFLAGSQIHCLIAAVGIHQIHAGICQIIHIEKFPQWGSCSPADYFLRAGYFCLMEAADQRRKHMAVGGMIIVVGPVQIRGHDTDIIGSVLSVQELAVFQSGDLRQCICLIGFLQLRSQQAALLHRLRCHTGIDTAAAQKHQLLAVVLPCRMDHIHLQDHIFIHEIRQCLTVGHDAAHLGCGQEHIVRLLPGKEFLHGNLSAQIQFLMAAGDDIGISVFLECSTTSTSYHTPVAGYIYFCVFFHDITVLPLFISPVIPRFPSTLPLQPLPASDRALPSDGTVPRSWFSGDSIPAPCGPSSDLPTD